MSFNRNRMPPGNQSTLILRQGLTSDRPMLDIYHGGNANDSDRLDKFVAPLTLGFYVRFNGVFEVESRLAIAYTAFSYMSEFRSST